jgi:hypothetical protein
MKLQRAAAAVLFVFVAGMVSATAEEISHSCGGGDQMTHSEGSHCPDPWDSGHPCGPACTCSCCPGHGFALAFVGQQLSLGISLINELSVQPEDDLHPKDVHTRVYHPPRA